MLDRPSRQAVRFWFRRQQKQLQQLANSTRHTLYYLQRSLEQSIRQDRIAPDHAVDVPSLAKKEKEQEANKKIEICRATIQRAEDELECLRLERDLLRTLNSGPQHSGRRQHQPISSIPRSKTIVAAAYVLSESAYCEAQPVKSFAQAVDVWDILRRLTNSLNRREANALVDQMLEQEPVLVFMVHIEKRKSAADAGDEHNADHAMKRQKHRALMSSPVPDSLPELPSKKPTAIATVAEVPDPTHLGHTLDESPSPWLALYDEHQKAGYYKTKSGATLQYTPPPLCAVHVLDLPPRPDRHFELLEAEIGLIDQLQQDGSTARAWRIPIRDAIKGVQFDAFTVPARRRTKACDKCRSSSKRASCDKVGPCGNCINTANEEACRKELHFPAHRWLTEAVCKDVPRIVELGRLEAAILNRAPFEVDINAWNAYVPGTGRNKSFCADQGRGFVELVSIIEWKRRHFPQLDFSLMASRPAVNQVETQDNGFFGYCVQFTPQKSGNVESPRWSWGPKRKESIGWMAASQYDASREPNLSETHLDEYQAFGRYFSAKAEDCTDVELAKRAQTNPNLALMLRAFQHAALGLVGLVGTAKAIANVWLEHLAKYRTRAFRARRSGPLDNRPFLSVSATKPFVWLTSWKEICPKTPDPITRGAMYQLSDGACKVHILNAVTNALKAGQPAESIAFVLYRMMHESQTGTLTRDMVIEQALASFAPADPSNDLHWSACMHCLTDVSRDQLRWVMSKTKGPILCCRQCSNAHFVHSEHAMGTVPTLDLILRGRCKRIRLADSEHTTPDYTAEELADYLLEKHKVYDKPGKYLHGFTQRPLDVYSEKVHLKPEIEKIHQRYGDQLHTPSNTILVPACLNRLHWTRAISILSVARNAVLLGMREEQYGPLRSDYQSDLAREWSINEAAQDHQSIVGRLTPMVTKTRFKQDRSTALDMRIRTMEKSGV